MEKSMKLFKDSLSAHVLNVLGVCIFVTLFASSGVVAAAQSTFDMEAVKAKYSVRDYVYAPLPERGYNYFKIAENAWFVHDDFENMVFFVTEEGVVVYDAKPDVTPYLLKVVAEVTDKPITHVIYSHHHRDHAEGMHLFPDSATIIANDETAKYLKIANDPKRPMPDVVWKDNYVLETGGLRLEFKDFDRNWHSQSDSIAYAPQQKILLATDTFHADAAPWIHFGEASNPMFAFQLPQILLETYDFQFMVTGHERIVATRAHLEQYKELLADMQKIVIEVAKSPAFHALAQESEQRYADGAKHWAYKEMITNGAKMCSAKFIERWAGRVRNVNLNTEENFQMMFMQLIILNP
jgi:glyoxylase-like metal-dependent hydrolase (beta-lactamase superfamily II)